MTRLLDFLRRFAVGFAYGLGFAVAFGGVMWATTAFMSSRDALSSADVTLVEHHRVPGAVAIVGTLKNTGSKALSFVMIQADLRDGEGRMVDQCMGHVSAAIEAGAERGFRVSCQKGTPTEFATYTLHVSGR